MLMVNRSVCLSIAFLSLSALDAQAVDDDGVRCAFERIVYELGRGTGLHIDRSGDTLCVQDGASHILFLDISDRDAPAPLGKLDMGSVRGIVLGDAIGLISRDDFGLGIVDFTDPQTPLLVGEYADAGVIGAARRGDTAYAITTSSMHVLDISDPSNPVLIREIPSLQANRIRVDGAFAYITRGDDLKILDLSDPTNPALLGELALPFVLEDYEVDQGFMYGVGGGGLLAIDARDPSAPFISDSHAMFSTRFLSLSEDRAFVGQEESGLPVFDISDPISIEPIGRFDLGRDVGDSVVLGQRAYVMAAGGLVVLDVSDPPQSPVLDTLQRGSDIVDIELSGGIACLAAQGTGLQLVDVSDPTDLRPMDTVFLGASVRGVGLAGSIAYVAHHAGGVRVVDISDPFNATEVTQFDTWGLAIDVIVRDGLAYVADGPQGISIFDVSDLGNPTRLGSLPTQNAQSIDLQDDLAYVADGDGGLLIVDIADPRTPAIVGAGSLLEASDVIVRDGLAFVTAEYGGASIIDVTDPSSPQTIATIPREQSRPMTGLVRSGNLLAISHGHHGGDPVAPLRLFDVSDPSDPRPMGFAGELGASSIAMDGDVALLGGYEGTLTTIDTAACDDCPADLTGDGVVDSNDFFAYLDAFANDDLGVCDLDASGNCDGDDFFLFLDFFAQGCD